MTLRELSAELERINLDLQKVRRADLDIPGDVAFQAAMRQHVVITVGEVRQVLDGLVEDFERVRDVETIMKARPSLIQRIQKALGSGEDT